MLFQAYFNVFPDLNTLKYQKQNSTDFNHISHACFAEGIQAFGSNETDGN